MTDAFIEYREKEAEDLARMLGERYGMGYVSLNGVLINTVALHLIEEQVARTAKVVLFGIDHNIVQVAVQTPHNPNLAPVLASLKERGYQTEVFLASEFAIEKALDVYKETQHTTVSHAGSLGVSEETIKKYTETVKNIADVSVILNEVKGESDAHVVSRIAEIIMGCAVALGVSDVHIESEEFSSRIRYRLDGILYDVAHINVDQHKKMLARLKLMAGIKLNVTGAAQDGRFTISLGSEKIEVRVSIAPSAYGQSVVMRLLNPKSINVPLEALGMDEVFYGEMVAQINKPNGMIITTGPTGSGKTTTLYATLKKKLTSDIKIITIEDPIEYHVEGLAQTQVDHSKGYDFAAGLRAAVRQDPDVVMVGEIRDLETAQTAIDAALTGHLVLSTIHTNSAAGAIPRFIEIGVNPKIIPSAMNFMIGQRLVRRLCAYCKEEYEPTGAEADAVTMALVEIKKFRQGIIYAGKLFRPKACDQCNHIGYKGRISIYEGIRMDANIEKICGENPSEREIAEVARSQGLLTMREDGILKCIKGITSLEEVAAAVGLTASR